MINVAFEIALRLGVYLLFIVILFRKLKTKSIFLNFLRSALIIFGIGVAIFSFASQFDELKSISSGILKGGSLFIALATFSCQKVLGNIVSGFVISSTRPFEIGDKVSLVSTSGSTVIEGTVMSITVRHTLIKKIDGKVCLVPNGVVDELIIINNHTTENNGYPLAMWCTYESDVELAMKLMQDEIENNELTIDTNLPQNRVLCSEMGDSGIRLQAVVWTRNVPDNFLACSQLRLSIMKVWRENGIDIPYNTLRIVSKNKN